MKEWSSVKEYRLLACSRKIKQDLFRGEIGDCQVVSRDGWKEAFGFSVGGVGCRYGSGRA
jgi:hypothetical protein